MKTVGIHPKVTWPTVALATISLVTMIVAVILKDSTLATIGATVLGASGVTAGVGFSAPPGEVTVDADSTGNGVETVSSAERAQIHAALVGD